MQGQLSDVVQAIVNRKAKADGTTREDVSILVNELEKGRAHHNELFRTMAENMRHKDELAAHQMEMHNETMKAILQLLMKQKDEKGI